MSLLYFSNEENAKKYYLWEENLIFNVDIWFDVSGLFEKQQCKMLIAFSNAKAFLGYNFGAFLSFSKYCFFMTYTYF